MEKTQVMMQCTDGNFLYESYKQNSREAINELIAQPHVLHANKAEFLHCGAFSVEVSGVVMNYEKKLQDHDTVRKAYENGTIYD